MRKITGTIKSDIILSIILLFSCKFIYEPFPEPPLEINNNGEGESRYRVFPINGTAQICNPSISLDTVNFKGCMLWLNFSGTLQLNVPSEMNFDIRSMQHDRLTITDTSNTVRWFIKRESLGADEREEFQDPEWSTHPEYIVTLLSSNSQSKWGCFVIHLLTNKYLKVCAEGLNQTSTPHLWVKPNYPFGNIPENIKYDEDGFIDVSSIKAFFGTSEV
ncbi:MAG: hypothetical protein N2053_01515, partial [Chitinispirillaceae bacterium]|nr:hypothetical protein [Chitinispirillaceae bacterium]